MTTPQHSVTATELVTTAPSERRRGRVHSYDRRSTPRSKRSLLLTVFMGIFVLYSVLPLLLVATLWYIVITSVLSVFQYYIERHFAKGAVRTLPLTPLQKAKKFFTLRTTAKDLR